MFGVFSAYEQQVLNDWISTPAGATEPRVVGRIVSHRARQRALAALGEQRPVTRVATARGVIRRHRQADDGVAVSDFSAALRELEQRVAAAGSKADAMQLLRRQMTPAHHHSMAGLMATRMFCQLME